MKAALATAYGSPDVIRIAQVPMPTPKPTEILVRIHASAVNAADWRLRRANPFVALVDAHRPPERDALSLMNGRGQLFQFANRDSARGGGGFGGELRTADVRREFVEAGGVRGDEFDVDPAVANQQMR